MQQKLQVKVIVCPSCQSQSIALDPARILSGAGLSCHSCGWVSGNAIPTEFGGVGYAYPHGGSVCSLPFRSEKTG